jgi:hypothetical protein
MCIATCVQCVALCAPSSDVSSLSNTPVVQIRAVAERVALATVVFFKQTSGHCLSLAAALRLTFLCLQAVRRLALFFFLLARLLCVSHALAYASRRQVCSNDGPNERSKLTFKRFSVGNLRKEKPTQEVRGGQGEQPTRRARCCRRHR